jgi:hypothetical protein
MSPARVVEFDHLGSASVEDTTYLGMLAPELVEPATVPEALLAVGVLYDPIERDVGCDHDGSHDASPLRWCCCDHHEHRHRNTEQGGAPDRDWTARHAADRLVTWTGKSALLVQQ